ncbi:N-alpha-acetyltransferase 25, NatB auxiliary subunit-like [Mizuhopecten yessoensis]|uniref:N-alpha-acetyltransferase 25, NatB auxiliary subunit-like n=1 Tax=Mizuhopecten yessoensis TaxID=6573 RepID=UPI000B45E2B8|nr:N-alpha-acetyltransferase 25, NatB auxiliary subunit-like [Mizuhopecten yessoensis]
MASRSHVDVNERRLRPIYDCLDNGNNKKAIQEADKVLKKQKDLQCARVLKALALLRLGRHDESAILLKDIHAQNPTDEATLQAMSICYREVYKLDLIADLYENAHKNRPDNEDILSSLFMAYVRLGDYKKQQQTAMTLHRLQPQKNPYYFWAVMSIVMQGHQDEKLAKGMFLPLAERMTKKYIEEEKITAEAEVQIYLIILELLEKWEDALKVVEGPLGDKLTSEFNFRENKTADLYTKLERWPQVNREYKKLLKENPDHWSNWQDYIGACLRLVEASWTPDKDSEEDIDYTENMVATFVQETIKQCEGKRPQRGPYLAQLELIRQMKDKNSWKPNLSESEQLGDPMQLLLRYYDLFGDKPCCFEDMKSFTKLLTEDKETKLISMITESVDLPKPEESLGYASSVKQMQRHITLLELMRYMGYYDKLSTDDRLVLIKEYIQRYHNGLDFGKNLLSTDLQYSDNYLLIAVLLLLDIWRETKKDYLVWQAIVQLEKGINNSRSNFHMKLILMRLYCIMGAYGPCHTVYESMEVKHVMNDTLGHTIANHVGRLGHFVAACAMYGTMLRFFAVNHKETAEYLIASYKYGSFSKIHEFVKFRERLQKSLQYSSAMTESMLLDLVLETSSHMSTEQMVTYMEIDPEKEKDGYDELCDNRDFSVVESWEPHSRCKLEEAKLHSRKEEVLWLKVRKITLRVLTASVMLGQQSGKSDSHTNNGIKHDKKPPHEVLTDLLSQLTQHIDSCKEYSTPYQYPVHGPFRTQLCLYLRERHCQAFTDMVSNVMYVQHLHNNGLDKLDNEKEEKLRTSVPDLISGLISKHKGSLVVDGENCINTSILENLVIIAETLSHVTILVGVCHRILKPLKSQWNKKSKKKKGEPLEYPCTFASYNQLVEGLDKAAKDLHQAIRDMDPVFLTIDLSKLSLTQSLCDIEEDSAIERDMWCKVEKSYQVSAREVTEFLHNKMQYLSTLRM